VPDRGPCKDSDECQGDSYCQGGRCIPYCQGTSSSNPTCKNNGFKPEDLSAPEERCSWTASPVISTPLVADLQQNGKPEIVFVTWNFTLQGAGDLVVLDGGTCSEVFRKPGPGTLSQLAIADLDADGKLEIAGIDHGAHIVVYDSNGALLATSDQAAKTPNDYLWGGPAIANLDGSNPPEIVYAGMAVRFQGGKLTTVFNMPVAVGAYGQHSAIADVDLDGTPEVIAGNAIFDGKTGADETPAPVKALPPGYPAVAQFDPSTPEPEIVLISSSPSAAGSIRIYHPKTGNVVFGPYAFGVKAGGPPTVADFDGDGKPEVAAAGWEGYALFDPDCAQTPLPASCHSPGIRWLRPTLEHSSGVTGSSVFDFNGDGRAEVVYRDECWMKVYDGLTGKALFASANSSATGTELPIVADVDNDGHADIVVARDDYPNSDPCVAEAELGLPFPGRNKGVAVYRDPKNRWMPSRPIWNQHTYHITNINDDGTVPAKEQNNWETWNNYRQNVQGAVKQDVPATDMTGTVKVVPDPSADCAARWELYAEICNRGTAQAKAGVQGTFYDSDPRAGGKKICTAATTKALDPGQCEQVHCTWKDPPAGYVDIWFAADDDGAKQGREQECYEGNNLAMAAKVKCPGIQSPK
jgi:hypothetical protein